MINTLILFRGLEFGHQVLVIYGLSGVNQLTQTTFLSTHNSVYYVGIHGKVALRIGTLDYLLS